MNETILAPGWRCFRRGLLLTGLALSLALFLGAAPVWAKGEELAERVGRSLEEAVRFVGVPGAVLGLRLPGGEILYKSTGLAEINHQSPVPDAPVAGRDDPFQVPCPDIQGPAMTPAAQFHVGSIRKTMAAALALNLAREGRLPLNGRLGELLPGLPVGLGNITVLQLLAHTSGLPDYVDHPDFYPNLMADPGRFRPRRELISYATRMPRAFRPGRGWHYANTNYVLLSEVIEKHTGRPVERQIEERFLQPLGLKNTILPNVAAMPEKAARGYRMNYLDERRWEDYTAFAHPSWLDGAGALITTAGDLMTWLKALLEGDALSDESRRLMMEWRPTGKAGERAGLGIFNKNGAIGHDGDYVFGYQAAMYRYKGLDFVVLTNGTPARLDLLDGASAIFRRVAAGLAGAGILPEQAPAGR